MHSKKAAHSALFRSAIILLAGLGFSLAANAQAICSVGNRADVLWKGRWYAATVTRVNETQTKCFIRYTGYGSEWDEWVGADRIRIANAAPQPAPASAWSVGDAVAVKWQGKWYPASVISKKQGLYKIHYDGYAQSWDEWVETSRMRNR